MKQTKKIQLEDATIKLCALLNSKKGGSLILTHVNDEENLIQALQRFYRDATSGTNPFAYHATLKGSTLAISPSSELVIDLQSHFPEIKSILPFSTSLARVFSNRPPPPPTPAFCTQASWKQGVRFPFQESDTLQLKLRSGDSQNIVSYSIPYLIGFANWKGGHVIHGVSDDGIIHGLRIPDLEIFSFQLESEFQEVISGFFPIISVSLTFRRIKNEEDMFVIILSTPPSKRFVCPLGTCGYRLENSEIKEIPRKEWEPLLFPKPKTKSNRSPSLRPRDTPKSGKSGVSIKVSP